jgi:UDP:flavonoid glycosyltransferase YjiC (YdhE family)
MNHRHVPEVLASKQDLSSPSTLPIILVVSLPAPGHTLGLLQIAEDLVKKGYTCVFVGGRQFEAQINAAGASFIETAPMVFDPHRGEPLPPPGVPCSLQILRNIFLEHAPAQFETLKESMRLVKDAHPRRDVIILYDPSCMAVIPFRLGATLPVGYERMPKVVGFNTSCNLSSSVDTAPFETSLPPARSAEDRNKYAAIYNEFLPDSRKLIQEANTVFRRLGATRNLSDDWLVDSIMSAPDIMLQACSPSLEYPRSDASARVRYIGGLPLKAVDPAFSYPNWWEEVKLHSTLPPSSPEKKRIVFVSQGTASLKYDELVGPSLIGLAGREDLLIIVTLGSKGAQYPGEVAADKNTRIIDYLPYDAILPIVDVFVCNAGYGSFMHAVMNGVPMVGAGVVADKGEVCMRAEWAGFGVNLRTQTPTPEQIVAGVDTILADGRFKRRAMELKHENEALDALQTVQRVIVELS